MKQFTCLSGLLIAFCTGTSFAQELNSPADSLSATQLKEITISAYGNNRNLLTTPATVGLVTSRNLERFSPVTFTNAVNTVPGIRMEERSPGSYRFSVRGSLMRSPFGVRNVKFYWNGIPFTDASGNTPLNSLDFGAVGRMEIIKGPGSSLYGAGTGGVVSMFTPSAGEEGNYADQSLALGGYGFQSNNTRLKIGSTLVQYGHQEQTGYRDHSGMGRDAITISSQAKIGKSGILSILGMYSDLHYQTPGGITLAQWQLRPEMARQPTPALPGSETQRAGIYSKYALLGADYYLPLSSKWSQNISVYMTTNDFANPFISNYEKRNEQGLGGRNTWQYQSRQTWGTLQWTSGFEWQYGKSSQRNYDNDSGQPAETQTNEDIGILSGTVFTQAEATLPGQITAAAGFSYNGLRYAYERYYPTPYVNEKKSFRGEFMPRVALNKVVGGQWSVTASVSQGFSPPTLQEVRPSAGGFYGDLEAEKGLNKEIVLRKSGSRLNAEISIYNFNLNQTISRRTNESGAEYFVNAGKTSQNGVEWSVSYDIIQNQGWIKELRLWHSATLTDYTYKDYISGENEFSGNRLPGISGFIQNTGADLTLTRGIGIFATYQYGSKYFLNDANTVETSPYHQFNIQASWKKQWTRNLYTKLSANTESVIADMYGLGYDLNAFGNRYYNAAPKFNWWTGIQVGWKW